MIKINLLSEGKRPAAVRKSKPARMKMGDPSQIFLAVGLLLGILTVAGWWWLLNGQIKAKQAEVAQAEAEVARLASVIKEVDDFKAKKAELERKIGIINDLKANQQGPVRVMDYISRSLPELLWLDMATMQSSSIEIDGRAFNTNAVANFMDNLDKVPEFDEPVLKDTQQLSAGVYRFTVDFNYSFSKHKEPEAASGAAGAVAPPAAPGGPAQPQPGPAPAPPPAGGAANQAPAGV